MEKIRTSYSAEIICFTVFIILTIFISVFHEPWHDEFQAWAISKDTLYNILFVIPHIEGHPPLWYLILKPFSALNINPEIGIRIPNLLFMYSAVFLLIFKSPFNKFIRLFLPFTYFFLYQYSIINRPYSLFCLALMLAGYFYKERNKHPYRYVFALCLLCLSFAYGIVLASGIIIVWLIEILRNDRISFFKTNIKDSRFNAILLIITLCLILTVQIFPDKLACSELIQLSKEKILYILLGLPCDALFSNIAYNIPKLTKMPVIYCFLGIFIYLFIFLQAKHYNVLLLFFIPYFMFLIVCSQLYIYGHHIGLLTVFFIFVSWCALSSNDKFQYNKYKIFTSLIIVIIIFVQIYWSICAYINEYKYDYWYSRAIYNYITNKNLTRYTIMSGWNVSEKPQIKYGKKYYNYNFNLQYIPVSTIPYFGKNIYYNFNILNKRKEYMVMRNLTEKENKEIINKLQKFGIPEIIIGYPTLLSLVFNKEDLENNYYEYLQSFPFYQIWKNSMNKYVIVIYVKDNIYKEIKTD